jgi:hypothetical protein
MNDVRSTEELLARLKRKPAPSDLRTRVLERTERRRLESGLLGPAGWGVLGASLVLLTLAWACDGLLSKPLDRRLSSALGPSGFERNPEERAWSELKNEVRLSNADFKKSPWLVRPQDGKSSAERETTLLLKTIKEDFDEL